MKWWEYTDNRRHALIVNTRQNVSEKKGDIGTSIVSPGRYYVHCSTSQKVAGSIYDESTKIFHLLSRSGRTMALGPNQLLTEKSTGDISWGSRRPVCRADNLTTFMCRLSRDSGTASTFWRP